MASEVTNDAELTYIDLALVYADISEVAPSQQGKRLVATALLPTRRFFYKKFNDENLTSTVVELTVLYEFPCALSRQRALLTRETNQSRSELASPESVEDVDDDDDYDSNVSV